MCVYVCICASCHKFSFWNKKHLEYFIAKFRLSLVPHIVLFLRPSFRFFMLFFYLAHLIR